MTGLFLWVKNQIDSSVLRFVFTEMETNYSLNEKSLLSCDVFSQESRLCVLRLAHLLVTIFS